MFNGEIITYTIGSRPTYSLVLTMLDQAFERLTDDDTLLIHSDQGLHYQMKQSFKFYLYVTKYLTQDHGLLFS